MSNHVAYFMGCISKIAQDKHIVTIIHPCMIKSINLKFKVTFFNEHWSWSHLLYGVIWKPIQDNVFDN